MYLEPKGILAVGDPVTAGPGPAVALGVGSARTSGEASTSRHSLAPGNPHRGYDSWFREKLLIS